MELKEIIDEQEEIIDVLEDNLDIVKKNARDKINSLYESDKSLREMCSNVTHNWSGISVNHRLFRETVKTLRRLGCNNLADELEETSIDTSVNGG